MNNNFLITRPNYDDATGYLFYYAKEVIDYAKKIGVEFFDLVRPKLTKTNFISLLDKKDPVLVLFNAHGDDKRIYGDKIKDKEEVLIEEGKNNSVLFDRIVYARACYSGLSLGENCIGKKGCFIGYRTPFSFLIDERWSAKPLNDKTAKLFLEPSNLIAISLLKGNRAEDAFDKSLNMMKKNMMKLMKVEKEPCTMASMMVLWNNMQGQTILGNKNAKFK
ncbi:MAG: hypothetical protein ABIH25_00445 [Candidatus Woesearchaeota archaeon]